MSHPPVRRWFRAGLAMLVPRQRPARRRWRPMLGILEDRLVPTAVSWTGAAGDFAWTTPGNWSTNAVPTSADDVTINVSSGSITVNLTSASETIHSLACDDNLSISSGGQLTVTNGFTLQAKESLTVNGASATFSATGTTVIDGGSCYAQAGGQITLTAATSYTNTATFPVLQANGTGSLLNLSGMTSLTVSGTFYTDVMVEAQAGGTVNLHNLSQVLDPTPAGTDYRGVVFSADGSGSDVDLSSLSTFQSNAVTYHPIHSELSATNGGTVNAPLLTSLNNVGVTLTGSGSTLPVSQYTAVMHGFITVGGLNPSFSNLTNVTDSSLTAQSGGTLSLPGVTSYTYTTQPLWQANGSGSLLALSGLTSLTLSSTFYTDLTVDAQAGATVNLHGLTQVLDPTPAGTDYRGVVFSADGSGSDVDLSNLTTFQCNAVTFHPIHSELSATNGGTVNAPLLTSLNNVGITLTGSGSTIPVGQYTAITHGFITVGGLNPTFTSLTNVNDSSLTAQSAGTLSLPGVTSYTYTTQPVWQANGSGSLVSLTGLTSLTVSSIFYTNLTVEAQAGATVNLHNLTQVLDPTPVGTNYRGVVFSGDATGSTVDLSNLATFQSTSATWYPIHSELSATNGGTVNAPLLTSLDYVGITITGSSTLPISQYTAITDGFITVGGTTASFAVTNITNSSVTAESGGTLSLPGVTSFTYGYSNLGLTWQSTGAGSLLDVSAVTTLTMATPAVTTMAIAASAGGTVDLHHLTQVVDPGPSSNWDRGITFSADGAGSLVNLAAFTSFQANATAFATDYSALSATNGGNLNAPLLTTLNNIALIISGASVMPISQYTAITNGVIQIGNTSRSFAVTDITGSELIAQAGAALSLPNVTSYSYTAYGTFWQATGAGSLIDVSAITTMTMATPVVTTLTVEAQNGGTVDLHNLTQVLDPGPAINGHRGVNFSADGSGSLVNLAALNTFQANIPPTAGWFSGLSATNGGDLNAPLLTSLNNIAVTITGSTSVMPISQYTSITNGSITISGTSTVATFSNLTDADNTTMAAQSGATFNLPQLATYTITAIYPPVTLTLSGAGSVLGLTDLNTINVVNGSFAVNGAQVSTNILNLNGGTITVTAPGTITANTLNWSAGTLTGANGTEVITVNQTVSITTVAEHQLNNLNLTNNGTPVFNSAGFLDLVGTAQFVNTHGLDIIGSTVDGSGSLVGNVILDTNGVISPGHSPGRVIIVGDYNQTPTAKLQMQIGGSTPGSGFDQVAVTGNVSLAGQLVLSNINNYIPPIGQTFDILNNQGGQPIQGTFQNMPEGATISVSGVDSSGNPFVYAYQITYLGGAGHDVVLTAVAATGLPVQAAATVGTVQAGEGATAVASGSWWDGNAGDTVTLSASAGTVVQSGGNASGTWSWSDATTDSTLQSQFVTITASNGQNYVASTTFYVQVNDLTPVVSAGSDTYVNQGTAFSRAGWFSDGAADGPWTAQANYGDGTGWIPLSLSNNTYTLSHTFSQTGADTVTVQVTDADGAVTNGSFVAHVVASSAILPVISAGSTSVQATEGAQATASGSWSDSSSGATVTLSASLGSVSQGGGNSNGTWSWSYTPTDAPLPSSNVTITATDGQGNFGTTTFALAVTNSAPNVTINGAPAMSPPGTPLSLSSTVTDAGSSDSFRYAWIVSANGQALAFGTSSSLTYTPNTPGIYLVGLAVTDDGGATTTTWATVTVSSVWSFKVSGVPSPTTAGTQQTFTVTALNKDGTTDTTYTGTVHFTSSDAQAALPANYTFTPGDNGVHSFSVTLKTAGTQSITATDTVATTATGSQTGITVNASAVSQLIVAGFPSPTTAGVAKTFTVTAADRYGNTVSSYTGKVSFTSSDKQALVPAAYTYTATDKGVHTFSATLKTAAAQSLTATDASHYTGTQSGIVINPAAAKTFTVAGFPSPTTAGVSGTFTVTAKDAYNNVATGYTGTVKFTSTDTKFVSPGNYTFTATDAGAHTFTVTFKTAGVQSITATDTVTASITGKQSNITVVAAAASQLKVASSVTTTTAGVAFNVTVTAQDPYGNTAPTYTGTIRFTSTDTAAVLPANYTFVSTDAGVHVFTNGATLKTVGKGTQTITATDAGNGTIKGTSPAIKVVAAAVDHLKVAAVTSTTAGTAITVTVTAQDAYNNTVTTYTGTVHFTSTDSQAVLPADYPFPSSAMGTHTFSGVILKTAGTQSITATDTVVNTVTGTANVTVKPAAATHLSISAPASVNPGTAFSFTVTMLDPYGNTATGYTGTVKFTSSDKLAVLPANYTFKTTDQGVRTFSATFNTLGTQSLTATDTVKPTITGTDPSINVASGVLADLLFSTPSTNPSLSAAESAVGTPTRLLSLPPALANGPFDPMSFSNGDLARLTDRWQRLFWQW